jgi:hypothetical protein
MEVSEDPIIKATLMSSLSGRPLGAGSLATLIRSTVWPQLSEALNDGLRYGIEDIRIDGSELAPVAPAIEELLCKPRLNNSLEYKQGFIHFEGQLLISGTLSP